MAFCIVTCFDFLNEIQILTKCLVCCAHAIHQTNDKQARNKRSANKQVCFWLLCLIHPMAFCYAQFKRSQAKPSQPKLRQAKPSQAKSRQAKPSRAKLSHANLNQANSNETKPSQARLNQAKLNKAKRCQAKLTKIKQSKRTNDRG